MGRILGKEYGLVLTIISLINVVPGTFGNVLNNIRLLYDAQYQEKGYEGDFNILLLIISTLNIAIVAVYIFRLESGLNLTHIILIIIMSLLWILNDYYSVYFRINLNYKSILLNQVIQTIGYIIGLYTIKLLGYWEFLYIIAYGMRFIYIIWKNPLPKERLSKTLLFPATIRNLSQLLVANALTRITLYADKLILYPLLGSENVAIYYVATLIGKVISMGITPMNSVALSYLSKYKKKPHKLFNYAVLFTICLCVLAYIGCILFYKVIIGFLYPQYVDNINIYVYITTASTMIDVFNSVLSPFVLKFCDMKYQIFLNVVTVVCYFIFTTWFCNKWALKGFCIGILITYLIKAILLLNIFALKPLRKATRFNYGQ